MPDPIVERAQRIADEVLLPAALATDAAEVAPRHLFDALAAAGLYGLGAPRALGGLAATTEQVHGVIEALASGCLTTTFVWLQHQLAMRSVATADDPLRDRWGPPMARGDVRAGVAFAHLRRPGLPVLTASEGAGGTDGWLLDGTAPWVTGWGLVDVLLVGARYGDDVVWVLADALPAPTLIVTRLPLAAAHASATVTATFTGHLVDAARLVLREPFDDWKARDALGLRANGSLALGVARRALTLLGGSPLDAELRFCRERLDNAGTAELPAARASATELALRAAAALMVAGAGRAIVRDSHAQRIGREALFLLVQGQTPAIRTEQLRTFGA